MIIRLCLVVVKSCAALYTISFMKSLCKKSYHITCPVLNKTFGNCYDELTPFDTFPCWAACLKIQLIFSRKIFPKLRCCPFCLIGRLEIFLSFRIGDIINTPCHIGQLTLSDKWMSAYKHPPSSALAGFAVSRCIGTCLRTYPPVGGLPPARAKYAEHKRSLCDGCISLSNAECLFLYYIIWLLLRLTISFMGVSALLICPYPGCFTISNTPFC